MRQLLTFFILFLMLGVNASAVDKKNKLIIQCISDNPDLQFLRPIYEINFKTKKVKVGDSEYFINTVTEDEIVIRKTNFAIDSLITFNRVNGKYYDRQFFFSQTGDRKDEKVIKETGQCIKIEKAF
jgi:hypothetical protein